MIALHSTFAGSQRFASLDGLRCLAILPVIWHHSTPRPLDGLLGRGPLGVHLFFAISGFLITTLLLRERETQGGVDLKAFYARRALRIFPLYYLVLALYAVRGLFWLPDAPLRTHFFASLPYYATYTGNWFVDYGVPHPVVFGFSWSLATEEQFYLLWPFVLFAARGWRVPFVVMASLFALDFATEHGWLSLLLSSEGLGVRMVTSISAPICLGALLAIALHHRRSFRWLAVVLGHRASAPLAAVLLGALIAAEAAPLWSIHLAMVALVGAVCIRPDHGLRAPLELSPVRYVGLVSYGLYLFHVSAITGVRLWWPQAGAFVVFSLATGLSLAVAAASYRFYELPFLRLKRRFQATARWGTRRRQAAPQYAAS